jgi:hypothetical protein
MEHIPGKGTLLINDGNGYAVSIEICQGELQRAEYLHKAQK